MEAEELGAGVESPLFLPTPSFMASQTRSRGDGLPFLLPSVVSLVRIYSFLGQAWAEGKGELATRTADGNWAKKCALPRCSLYRLNACTIKQPPPPPKIFLSITSQDLLLHRLFILQYNCLQSEIYGFSGPAHCPPGSVWFPLCPPPRPVPKSIGSTMEMTTERQKSTDPKRLSYPSSVKATKEGCPSQHLGLLRSSSLSHRPRSSCSRCASSSTWPGTQPPHISSGEEVRGSPGCIARQRRGHGS